MLSICNFVKHLALAIVRFLSLWPVLNAVVSQEVVLQSSTQFGELFKGSELIVILPFVGWI